MKVLGDKEKAHEITTDKEEASLAEIERLKEQSKDFKKAA